MSVFFFICHLKKPMIISDTVSEYDDVDIEIISEQDISCDPDERNEYDMIIDEEQ